MSGRIKVLWLIKGLGPGGAERLLVSSARVRDQERFDIEVAYLLERKSDLRPQFEELGIKVHCLRGGTDLDIRWVGRLRELVRLRRYDAVHTHAPYVAGIARPALRALPRAVRPALFYTEHLPWFGYRGATRALNALTYPLDDVQLAVSQAVVDSIPRRLSRRIQVVHQGIDVEEVRSARTKRAATRKKLGVSTGEVLISTVANYRGQKDYPNLFNAAEQVLTKQSSARFVAIGQGPLRAQIEADHARRRFGDRFQLLGHRDDVPAVLAACDIFALASKNEGLPIALVEALALGKPIVATAVGGTVEAVTDTREGFLVPASNPGALAAAIERLVADPSLRRRMAKAATARAAEFDIATAVRKTEEIYRRALSR